MWPPCSRAGGQQAFLKTLKKNMTKNILFIFGNSSWFPRVTAVNYHKPGGLKQQRCVLSQFQRSAFWNKVSAGLWSLMPQGRSLFVSFSFWRPLSRVIQLRLVCSFLKRPNTEMNVGLCLGQSAAPLLWTQSSPTSVHQPMLGSGLKNIINISTIFCG